MDAARLVDGFVAWSEDRSEESDELSLLTVGRHRCNIACRCSRAPPHRGWCATAGKHDEVVMPILLRATP